MKATRRGFLKMLGLAGGVVAAPSAVVWAFKAIPEPFYKVPSGKTVEFTSLKISFRPPAIKVKITGIDANGREVNEILELCKKAQG